MKHFCIQLANEAIVCLLDYVAQVCWTLIVFFRRFFSSSEKSEFTGRGPLCALCVFWAKHDMGDHTQPRLLPHSLPLPKVQQPRSFSFLGHPYLHANGVCPK